MPRTVSIHFLPDQIPAGALEGQTAVVIDILRASTTILQALDAGAIAVHPFQEVDEARRATASLPRPVLLGGERGGKKIKGFDLDNSPWNYTDDVCRGAHLVFTTTNGTRALHACREAERVLIGGFTNLSALLDTLYAVKTDVHLVCAGTDGEITYEDVLFAGAVCRQLLAIPEDFEIGNDPARVAQANAPANLSRAALVDLLRVSRGGENLLELGFERDLEFAAEVDRTPLLAVWDPELNRIVREVSFV